LQTSQPVLPFSRAASLAVTLAGCLLLHWAGRTSFQQPVHHWRLSGSNRAANQLNIYFQLLAWLFDGYLSAIWDAKPMKIHKLIEMNSTLATRTVMSSASGHENSPDRCLAAAAGLSGTLVDAML